VGAAVDGPADTDPPVGSFERMGNDVPAMTGATVSPPMDGCSDRIGLEVGENVFSTGLGVGELVGDEVAPKGVGAVVIGSDVGMGPTGDGVGGLVANFVGAGLGASVTLSSIGLVVGFAVDSGTAGGGSGASTVGSFVGLGVLTVGTLVLVGLFVATVGFRVGLGVHLTFDLLPLEVLALLALLAVLLLLASW